MYSSTLLLRPTITLPLDNLWPSLLLDPLHCSSGRRQRHDTLGQPLFFRLTLLQRQLGLALDKLFTVLNIEERVVGAGDTASDIKKVEDVVNTVDKEVLGGTSDISHMSGHLFTRDNSSGVLSRGFKFHIQNYLETRNDKPGFDQWNQVIGA